jgi:hypothetical protein
MSGALLLLIIAYEAPAAGSGVRVSPPQLFHACHCFYCIHDPTSSPSLSHIGLDGEGHTFPWMNTWLWEATPAAYDFVYLEALPKIHAQSVRNGVCVALSDGDPFEIASIEAAIAQGVIPNAKRKRCFFHAAAHTLAKKFGVGHWDFDLLQIVRGWLNHLAYVVEAPDDYAVSVEALMKWINENYDHSVMMSLTGASRVNKSRAEALCDFVKSLDKIKGTWAKCCRRGLRDLGHITTAISEAANGLIKSNNLVNRTLGLDRSTHHIDKLEQVTLQNHTREADMQANRRTLTNQKQHPVVTTVSSFLTRYCVRKFVQSRYANYVKVDVRRIAERKWETVFRPRSGASDYEQTTEAIFDKQPWPCFNKTRTLWLDDNDVLMCDCELFQSTLAPCIDQMAVKNGQLIRADFHFRHYIEWQSGHIPFATCPRFFGDGAPGPTAHGIDMAAPIVLGFTHKEQNEAMDQDDNHWQFDPEPDGEASADETCICCPLLCYHEKKGRVPQISLYIISIYRYH